VGFLRDLFFVCSYHFHIYADDLQIYHTCAVSELNLDLQRVHEWAATNDLKLNPIKSQVIVISRCRVDIPPLTLLIGSDVIKVNERLTITDHFKKVRQKVCWILRTLRSHAWHTPFEVRRRLLVSLIMPHIRYGGYVYMLVRMLHHNGGYIWLLGYVYGTFIL
jgi:hypothetical protein